MWLGALPALDDCGGGYVFLSSPRIASRGLRTACAIARKDGGQHPSSRPPSTCPAPGRSRSSADGANRTHFRIVATRTDATMSEGVRTNTSSSGTISAFVRSQRLSAGLGSFCHRRGGRGRHSHHRLSNRFALLSADL